MNTIVNRQRCNLNWLWFYVNGAAQMKLHKWLPCVRIYGTWIPRLVDSCEHSCLTALLESIVRRSWLSKRRLSIIYTHKYLHCFLLERELEITMWRLGWGRSFSTKNVANSELTNIMNSNKNLAIISISVDSPNITTSCLYMCAMRNEHKHDTCRGGNVCLSAYIKSRTTALD
jgi:hypothetical protein